MHNTHEMLKRFAVEENLYGWSVKKVYKVMF